MGYRVGSGSHPNRVLLDTTQVATLIQLCTTDFWIIGPCFVQYCSSWLPKSKASNSNKIALSCQFPENILPFCHFPPHILSYWLYIYIVVLNCWADNVWTKLIKMSRMFWNSQAASWNPNAHFPLFKSLAISMCQRWIPQSLSSLSLYIYLYIYINVA